MQKFKIVPSEEGGDMAEAMQEFNSVYVPFTGIVDHYSQIPDEQKSKLFGQVAGTIDVKAKKYATGLGLDVEGKKTNEIVEMLATTYEAKIAELTEKNANLATNVDNATKAEIEALKQQVSDLSKLNEKIKADLEDTVKVKTEIENSFSEKERQLIIQSKLEKARNQFVLVEDQNTRDACQLDILNLKFEIDANGTEIVRGANGEAILSSTTTGHANYSEVLEKIYTKRNAHKKVTGGGQISAAEQLKDITPVSGRTLAPRK